MTKLWLVALYEYKRIVFKASFLLALLSVPLIISLNIGIGLLLEGQNNKNSPVGYVDHSGILSNPILAPVSGSKKPINFISFHTKEEAKTALENKSIQAYYVIADDYLETSRIDLVYLEEPGRNATRQFYDFIQINLLADKPSEISYRAAEGTHTIVRAQDGRREIPNGGPTFGIIMPLLIGIAIIFLLIMSSSYLMQAVVDEKENRTMEVLATSLSPMQFISGKVLGIVAISFTQLVTWITVCLLGIFIAGKIGIEWFQDTSLDWGTILATVAVGIPAYILASALMTAIGATVTSTQEGQSTGGIFFILHFIPLYLAWSFVETPNNPLAITLSLLPFTALATITLRNIFTAVPMWQVAASVLIQSLCAIGALWLAGRAFRLGMLRYGQRLKFRSIIKRTNPERIKQHA